MKNKKAVSENAYTDKSPSAPDTATYSIADIKEIFKSKLIKKYNSDYKAELKEIATISNDDEKTTPKIKLLFQSAYNGSPSRHDKFYIKTKN